jgi:hypothetical protein
MSEHVFQPRSGPAAPASVRTASARPTTAAADPPASTGGIDTLHAALNGTPKVRQTTQLRRSLSQAPRAAQLARLGQMAQRGRGPGHVVQRLELTDAIWKHIAQGELRDGKKLVGYHWTGGTGAIARKNGTKKEAPDERGVYVEGVETIEEFGQGKNKGPIVKANASTFWPDAWSEAEIKNAIANAAPLATPSRRSATRPRRWKRAG